MSVRAGEVSGTQSIFQVIWTSRPELALRLWIM